jgi:hypothetical protein
MQVVQKSEAVRPNWRLGLVGAIQQQYRSVMAKPPHYLCLAVAYSDFIYVLLLQGCCTMATRQLQVPYTTKVLP